MDGYKSGYKFHYEFISLKIETRLNLRGSYCRGENARIERHCVPRRSFVRTVSTAFQEKGEVRERIRREGEREREGGTTLVCASRSGFTHDRPKGEETPRPRCFLHHRGSLEPPVDTEIFRSEEASPKAWRHSLPPFLCISSPLVPLSQFVYTRSHCAPACVCACRRHAAAYNTII